MKALLRVTSQNPGKWISFENVRGYADRNTAQAKGELAAFSQFLKKQFSGKSMPLLIHVKQSTGDTTRYCMPESVASVLRREE